MASVRKFSVPHLPGIVLWGTIAGLLAIGVLVTVIDLTALPKAEAARAMKQKQRFVVNATTGEVRMGDDTPAPQAKPAEAPAATPAPVTEVTPAQPPAEAPPTPPAEPVATPVPPPAATPSAPEPAAPPAAATSPAPAPAAAAEPDPLAKTAPSLRTEPLSESLKEQPRTKDSLVGAPAPEITETVDGLRIPKRGDKDTVASKLYAHPFKRQPDQILISFVVLNTGLDPQSIGLAMGLPSEVTVAYSPYTHSDMAYSENVRAVGHEVWTMLPAMGEHYPSDDPGPMGIIGKMPPEETTRRVREVMAAIPGAVGLILPPDETVIPHKETMGAVLSEISSRGLFLMTTNPNHGIDQITTNEGLTSIIRRADLVLDPTPNESQIRSRLAGLLDAAKDKGEFVVVLSSRPQSLQILSDWLAETKLEAPYVLAPLSAIYQPAQAAETPAAADAPAQKEKKAKPPPKMKPKVLPQDQYEPKAADKDKKPETN